MSKLFCIQCAMKAMLANPCEDVPAFDETIEEHIARVHPDPADTQRERFKMERELADKLAKVPHEDEAKKPEREIDFHKLTSKAWQGKGYLPTKPSS